MSLEVVMDPEQRQEYLDYQLMLDGLSHIEEDTEAAYCAIALTSVPEVLKRPVQERQDAVIRVLNSVGLIGYDPASAPYSPDAGLTKGPEHIYVVDSSKIVGARYFVWHNILPTTGVGIEWEKAKTFNRVPVLLFDNNIRTSRMHPHRAIKLQYGNFQEEASQFGPVFEMLKGYEPGMGFNDGKPVLVGFRGNDVVDLEAAVYKEFPELEYKWNGEAERVQLSADNPELFYELGGTRGKDPSCEGRTRTAYEES
ncbi:MAG: hypothetical protein ACE5FT_03965 [Candidatus Nanoarchaeia archaeon]